ncbi:MAG TPA: sulfite exporter TauE/SafE family protein [Myxococcales bacterium]|nr:sulfite exporter TauE/SafE family protein [Myxococcales bacterium]
MWKALAIGGLLGLLSGFFGLGGSSVATPLLRLVLGLGPLLALATPLPVVIPGSALAAWTYHRAGCLDLRVGAWTLAASLPAALLGTELSDRAPTRALMLLTGALVASVGVAFAVQPFFRPARRPGGPAQRQPRPLHRGTVLLIGALVGFLSGLLANGGGILLAPAYMLLLRLTTKEAFGTSLFVVVGTALPSSVLHAWLGHVDYALVPALAIAMMPMAVLGARLALAAPPRRIRQAYGLAMIALAVVFVVGELRPH